MSTAIRSALEGGTLTRAVSEPLAKLNCYGWVKPLVDGGLVVGAESGNCNNEGQSREA